MGVERLEITGQDDLRPLPERFRPRVARLVAMLRRM